MAKTVGSALGIKLTTDYDTTATKRDRDITTDQGRKTAP